jgi:hypothetical protein
MAGKGHPRSFPTAQDFRNRFDKYIDKCIAEERLPNVAGFCVFADITRETYYKQREYYSDTFKKIEMILEDEALNTNIAPAVKIFYLKNKFSKDYKDKQEVEHSGDMNINTNLIDKYLKE